MSSESAPQAFRTGAAHRRHLRHDRGREAWLHAAGPGLVQPRPGPARDRGRCPVRRRACRRVAIDPGDQEYAPVAGLWELREAIAAHYNRALPARPAVAVHGGERQRVGRRPRRADPRRGEPRARSTSATFSPITRRTRSCSTSSRPSPPSPSCSKPSAGYAFVPDATCARRVLGRGLSAILLSNPCNPTGKVVRAADLEAGCDRSRARLRAALRRVLLALRLDRPRTALRSARRRTCEDVESRPGRDLRRAHQELALPRLARHLDGRAPRPSSTP